MDSQGSQRSLLLSPAWNPYEMKPILGQLFLSPRYTLQSATMKMMLLSLFAFVNLLGSLAQEDLHRKVFVFPTTSRTAHVVLNAKPQQALTTFTVCLRSYTDLTRHQTIFSYASKRNFNEIVVDRTNPNEYQLWMGIEHVSFTTQGKETYKAGWEHVCVSWESGTGLVTFWLNGQPFPRKSLKKGHSISPEASILLGQDQDSFGGGFDANQCFIGEVKDVYMTDRVLSTDEVVNLLVDSTLPNSDYLINWRSLSYTIKGYAIVRPSIF